MMTAMSGRVVTKVDAPKRGGRARAVSEMIPAIGATACRRFGFVQSSVVSRWAEIVGERYAEVSAPESIRFPRGKREGGVLHLVISGANGTMVQHCAPAIVERVNRFFGYEAVTKLAIRQGLVSRPAPATAQATFRPAPLELGDSLRAIADPELKAVLESLARGVASAPLEIAGKVS